MIGNILAKFEKKAIKRIFFQWNDLNPSIPSPLVLGARRIGPGNEIKKMADAEVEVNCRTVSEGVLPSCNFSTLSDEIIIKVVGLPDIYELTQIAEVSKRWNEQGPRSNFEIGGGGDTISDSILGGGQNNFSY